MNVYRHYRKFRNYIRTLPAMESLTVIHAYTQYFERGAPMPEKIGVDPVFYDDKEPGKRPHLWEFELLAKEAVLNASFYGTRSFNRWEDLAGAINILRELEVQIVRLPIYKKNILFELHR